MKRYDFKESNFLTEIQERIIKEIENKNFESEFEKINFLSRMRSIEIRDLKLSFMSEIEVKNILYNNNDYLQYIAKEEESGDRIFNRGIFAILEHGVNEVANILYNENFNVILNDSSNKEYFIRRMDKDEVDSQLMSLQENVNYDLPKKYDIDMNFYYDDYSVLGIMRILLKNIDEETLFNAYQEFITNFKKY